ncbi:hypothetical protein Q3G72_034462 [Acer saccharum]|nr:hypothetical protein Q3G72_034462 [Acer saccharum]
MSTEGYKEANVAIDKLTIQMKRLLPSSSTVREENVHQSKTEMSVQVKDLVIVATKGSIKQKTKSSGKARKCGNCGQPEHTKKDLPCPCDGRCQPFVFHNYDVPMGNLSNESPNNVFSMTSSTQAMYMQQTQWWRPHNLM